MVGPSGSLVFATVNLCPSSYRELWVSFPLRPPTPHRWTTCLSGLCFSSPSSVCLTDTQELFSFKYVNQGDGQSYLPEMAGSGLVKALGTSVICCSNDMRFSKYLSN